MQINKYVLRIISLYAMAVLYFAAGLNHFIQPAIYRPIMPSWIGWHDKLIIISGVCEISFALFLLFPRTRRVAACCIMGLLFAVFPANIQMMVNDLHENSSWLWLSIMRLPLQIVLIYWAYRFTKPVAS